jgi:geranyl-CoA carboxylase alpha subunit
MTRFHKVLIANRGEIALRVIRSCKALGYRTVAVCSDADRDAPHVLAADEAVHIGASPAKESYLVASKILDAAQAAGAEAIHPGYGFLSENEGFARACRERGLVFIGPSPEAIELMGNKRQAKLRMIAAGVPCVPGYEGAEQSDDALLREAERIGMPLMVKAAAGGGGRGMRLVRELPEVLAALRSARSEAENAFGSGELILERAVLGARHVEIQVFADEHGNVVHLGERDCSVQRRHQKVAEESPSPAVDDALRRRMGEVAVTAAKAIDYRGAGTLEFLLAPSGEFYFMEMNTRLQVEHPVTEMITGLDLVEWQLLVASGRPLPLRQDEIVPSGHAIEVRLCAEDPANGFLPQTGALEVFRLATGPGIRVDCGVREGQTIAPFYDSMQAKVIAHGPTRDEARRRLLAALTGSAVLGVVTNKDLLVQILAHEAFASGAYDTGFIAAHFGAEALEAAAAPSARERALAAAVLFDLDGRRLREDAGFDGSLSGWNSSLSSPVGMKLACRAGGVNETTHPLSVALRGDGRAEQCARAPRPTRYEVRSPDGEAMSVELTWVSDVELRYSFGGASERAFCARRDEHLWLATAGGTHAFADATFRPPRPAEHAGDGKLKAPMDGKILSVAVKPGDAVTKGQAVAVLEAMKMEVSVVADLDGKVEAVEIAAGAQVKARQLLVSIAAASSADQG